MPKGFGRLPTSPKSSNNKCFGCGHGITTHGSKQGLQTAQGVFHPECFQCNQCRVKLTGKYAHEGGNPFCEKCYLDLHAAKCAGCSHAIQGEFIKALGQNYHQGCFGCAQCKAPFKDGRYCEVKGKPYCQKHAETLLAPACSACRQPILGNAAKWEGRLLHPECFTCKACKKQLPTGAPVMTHQKQPFCQPCHTNRFADRCAGCHNPIEPGSQSTRALDKLFHLGCFKCSDCETSLGGTFVPLEGSGYCEPCAKKKTAPTCSVCSRPILDESYTQYEGRPMHKGCFQCHHCHKVLPGQFWPHRGKSYCQCCHAEQFCPRCESCSITAMGNKFHPACFRCETCKVPVQGGKFYQREGKVYCENDFAKQFTPECAVCKAPTGWDRLRARAKANMHFMHNFWGEIFCAEHEGKVPKCSSCGRLVLEGGGGADYDDGRLACKVCVSTAIQNPKEAAALWKQVQREVALMGLPVPGDVPFEIQDRHGMKAAQCGVTCTHSPKEALGLTVKREEGRMFGKRSVDRCLCLKGLPGQHMAATMAHEMTHCYLWLAGFPKLPAAVEEGLCELVSAEWLNHTSPKVNGKQDAVAAYLLHTMQHNPDPVYGGGYRSARQAMQKLGTLGAVLGHVKAKRGWPPGPPMQGPPPGALGDFIGK